MTSFATYEGELEGFFASRIARLRSGTGWLSLVDKIFLSPGTTELRLPDGSSGGTVVVDGRRVTLDGRELKSDKDGAGDAVNVRGFVLELMERGDTLALRVRDHRELPRPFAGISRFPVNQGIGGASRFEPYTVPKEVLLDFEGATESGGVTDVFVSPGRVVFEHGGAEHRLEAVWEGASRSRLMILFRDATSGKDSYPLGRLLYANAPDENGVVYLDFNRALLPGCAFSVYATCPIAPRENTLSIEVRAGERFYQGKAVGEP